MYKKHKIIAIVGLVIVLFFVVLQHRSKPEVILYGLSFSEFKARELNLDPKETFNALTDDLGVSQFRLSSHWPIVEPENNVYDFGFLDYQIQKLEAMGGSAILTLGRRQPAWPECHVPNWARNLSEEERNKEILDLVETTVKRYKNSPAIEYWQVENEPFLGSFATDECGPLDRDFLDREIALVRELDSSRDVLVTDSGNIGTWVGAWKAGDLFGTSLYRFFWTPEIGIFESKLPAAFYRTKYNIVSLLYGKKPAFLIELALEPWLTQKIVDTDIDVQISRMDIGMVKDSVDFALKTGFDTQYLWGGEWWYYMSKNNHPEYWDYMKTVFKK